MVKRLWVKKLIKKLVKKFVKRFVKIKRQKIAYLGTKNNSKTKELAVFELRCTRKKNDDDDDH